MSRQIYDVVIIGGGPAGLTAGIYCSRERLKTLLLEKAACGGWPAVAGEIENYPGFPGGVNGLERGGRIKEQAEKFGVEIREFEEVKNVKPGKEKTIVETTKGEYETKSLVAASGSRQRKLGVPGEEEFLGKGVSYCATCDGPLFRERAVAVIGGGNAALEEALFLTKFASRVYLVHRRGEFRGARILEERLKESDKVEFVLMFLEYLPRLGVCFLYNRTNFLIYHRSDFFGVVALLAQVAAEEYCAMFLAERQRPEFFRHAVFGDHRARKLCCLL